MKIIDRGEILDKFCDYLNQHRKETGIKIKRENNSEAWLEMNSWLGDTIGSVKLIKNKLINIDIWKVNLSKLDKFTNFKNLLKDFEVKNKVNVVVEMK